MFGNFKSFRIQNCILILGILFKESLLISFYPTIISFQYRFMNNVNFVYTFLNYFFLNAMITSIYFVYSFRLLFFQFHWLKIDFNRWRDEDDSDAEMDEDQFEDVI